MGSLNAEAGQQMHAAAWPVTRLHPQPGTGCLQAHRSAQRVALLMCSRSMQKPSRKDGKPKQKGSSLSACVSWCAHLGIQAGTGLVGLQQVMDALIVDLHVGQRDARVEGIPLAGSCRLREELRQRMRNEPC